MKSCAKAKFFTVHQKLMLEINIRENSFCKYSFILNVEEATPPITAHMQHTRLLCHAYFNYFCGFKFTQILGNLQKLFPTKYPLHTHMYSL